MISEKEATILRHSVRQYKDQAIAQNVLDQIQEFIDTINKENDFSFQVVTNDTKPFGFFAKYGSFKNASNYIAIIGPKGEDVKVGYYMEKLVIYLQQLGLNSCICGLAVNKKKTGIDIKDGDEFFLNVCFGYGENQGRQHKDKPYDSLINVESGTAPEWFVEGAKFALMAPTALNQQKFVFTYLANGHVKAECKKGPYSKCDLGIVKYNFEVGAAPTQVIWEE